jgi:hypothetical protein
MREKTRWRVRKATAKIIAYELIIKEDSPTYLAQFNSDSFRVSVNTFCTCTLSGNKNYFENLQLYKGQSIKDIAGGSEIAGESTFVFWIQSDHGQINTIKIPQSFYMPGLKLPLLSPQHWAKTAKATHLSSLEQK